ncbi:MAG: PQQ-dependent sugar dehydrogenase [Henriciella sp.]|uniref:PQQ-dependent sugar dehydrogenase n=1 Tax=Henriciella sp. TaxID=1968823 RepID=UPI003C7349A9
MAHRSPLALVVFAGLLGACGGGGGGGNGGGSPTPPVNQAPVFTSAATTSLEENAAGVFYTIEANDPDGGAVTLSVVSGGDEASFSINLTTGDISPDTPLDFEAPADADTDNVYEITVRATDNEGAARDLALSVTVTDVAEDGVMEVIGSGFTQPLYIEPIPGTALLAVVEKGGLIRTLDPATGTIGGVAVLDVSGEVSTNSERGLLGMAFSPGFASDRTFYVNLTNTAGNTEIRRYQMMTGSSTQADPATADIIFTAAQPAGNHNAGWIGFSNAGLLYVPLGDGGGGGDPDENAQDVNEVLGKVLRLDISGDDYPADDLRDYAIPPSNPFASGGGRPEIFAIGVRNPFRCSVDAVTGDLFIGDVGQNAIEEIDRLPPDGAGVNFGWDTREGTQSFEGPDDPAFTDPVAEYGHGSGPFEGNSVTGGLVYRGPVATIQDHYVFADFVSDNWWSIPVDDLVNGSTVPSGQFQRLNDLFPPDTGTLSSIAAFGLDADGNLLVVSITGSVYRLSAAAP